MSKELTIFKNGATSVRADFHLHTRADSEFIYEDEATFFAKNFIDKLEQQNIRVGVITNHNKFDDVEFKELKKNAIKREIYLLPGVELSIKDGKKGLHILVVFCEDWIVNIESQNFIQQFLNAAFSGIVNFDKPPYEANSIHDFKSLCNALDRFKKDYFIILAHVDDSSGLFIELDGRGLSDFVLDESFSRNVLALQKVRTYKNIARLKSILSNKVPAFVEGSDCAHKGIAGIGIGNEVNGATQKTYIKIGDYNFDAIKYALKDHKNRLKSDVTMHSGPYIKSVKYISRRLGEKTIDLSPSMNNFIGIRGSGKSSLLESIRYLLDIPLSPHSKDYDYKKTIVLELLGSGGKMVAEIIDSRGQTFTLERILGETANIYLEGDLQQNLKIDSIISNPLYFGQKDLSELGSEASTDDLIGRLIGNKITEISKQIGDKSTEVEDLLRQIGKIDTSINREQDLKARKADLEIKEKAFKLHNVDKKLSRQLEFERDKLKLSALLALEDSLINNLNELWTDTDFSADEIVNYISKENLEIMNEVFSSVRAFSDSFNQIFSVLTNLQNERNKVAALKDRFSLRYDELRQEFSDIKRTIDIPNINPDTYIRITTELGQIDNDLLEISKLNTTKVELSGKLKIALADLKQLWYQEYEIVRKEIDKINSDQSSVRIEVEFKGSKEKLKDYLKDILKGSNITDKVITTISTEYSDIIEIYNDLRLDGSKIKSALASSDFFTKFNEKFRERSAALLTFRVPDKYNIYYKERPLKEHSLGQRASAVILFILSLKDNDLILIDQPEDDLDNQTIYEDVITELKKLKDKTQFIFATHNPNIPVLGDCEQIISCSFLSDEGKSEIKAHSGGIDNLFIQGRIVSIMEGGKEAFNHRKMIYDNWKQELS